MNAENFNHPDDDQSNQNEHHSSNQQSSINLSAIIPQTNIGNYRDCCDPDNNSNDQTTSTISCSIQMDQISTQHNNSSSSSSSLSTEQSSSTTMDHHHHVANMNNNDNHSYRSRNSITSILNFYRRNSNNLIFDANTFKQVKRLYCGMLLVAIAYSVTMVIMMMVLYKSLPESTYNNYRQQQQYHRINEHKSESQSQPKITTVATILTDKESVSVSSSLPPSPLSPPVENESSEIIKNNRLWMMDTSGQTLYRHYNQQYGNRQASTSYVNRTQLDQVIAINFLTTILYIMAFYAAQREFYHLTLAFTTTLAVSMIISSVKILSEGSNFPNNLMGILLRMSIVLTALIYSSQIRKKQIFINQAQTFWLNHPHTTAMLHDATTINNNNNNNSSSTTTTQQQSRSTRSAAVQLIQEIFGVSPSTGTLVATHPFHATVAATASSSPSKTENIIIQEYQDQPPDYEEALRCPMPVVRSLPVQTPITYPRSALTITSSTLSLIAPPSFDQLKTSSSITTSLPS
ncbi:hypothetical protein HUG17_9057 [Dermatophagoides farinae]|uniref:Uncharacterized protein n=2 Tax=Dermatophagoides farinae TaxID=6954 RepID=A0A9D4NTB3_DERFA|nr:hypothetical protein HUG17_9057 [Dermatophagoides farinae]